MGTIHYLLVLLFVHCTTARGRAELSEFDKARGAETRVINGKDADEEEFPFVVRLQRPDGYEFCSGSLIAPQIVLTAAHCLTWQGVKTSLDRIRAAVGSNKVEGKGEQVLKVIRTIIPEEYDENVLGAYYVPHNDVAVIVLEKEVDMGASNVGTINLPKDESLYATGTQVTVAGWGVWTDEGPLEELEVPDTLQKLDLKIADKKKCIEYWKQVEEDGEERLLKGVVSDEFQTLDDIAGALICTIGNGTSFSGDSGGPVFVKDGEEFTQVGIVSWGTMDPKLYTYNLEAKLYNFVDWVKAAVKRASENNWIELNTLSNHGMVMVHGKDGSVKTVCKENVGVDEVNAVCRDLGFKMGELAHAGNYLPKKRRRMSDETEEEIPSFGFTDLSCKSDAKSAFDCDIGIYSESDVPCFNGDQLTVKCANEAWYFSVTNMDYYFKTLRGSNNVKGGVDCTVGARKYGMNLDMKNQVKVGLVVRGEEGLKDVGNTKWKKKISKYFTKVRATDEVKEDDCFACIAYLPGTEFYAVGKRGPDSCPDNKEHYEKWIQNQTY